MNDLSVIEAEFGDLSQWSQCPKFWVAKPDMGMPFIESLREASIHCIGTSAGGRDILAISYGEKEALDASTDNLQSALAAKVAPADSTDIYPTPFYGSQRRKKPVVVLQGGIHGGELTGTVASLNLCKIIETGTDLRGKAWPRLQELARATRLVIIPWLNIDGVERWPLPNCAGAPLELLVRCTFGVTKGGTPYRYPAMKSTFPIPPAETSYMGTYFNDAGVNLQYDFCQVERQPETLAWMRLYLDERPDGIVVWHCNAGTLFGPPGYYLPEGMQHHESRLGGAVRSRLLREGYAMGRMSWAGLPGLGKPYITQSDAAYHVCGGTPFMCELPAGCPGPDFSLDEMLDIGLITIEETLHYAHTDGLRAYELWEKVKGRN